MTSILSARCAVGAAISLLAASAAAQSDWTVLQNLNPRPSARMDHAMAYDPVLQRTVLFGGLDQSGMPVPLGDTWLWDGTSWNQDQGNAPADRFGHAMAYDIARQEIVLFGGTNGSAVYNDTWVFNGTNWQQRSPTVAPGGREHPAMAYDTSRARVVMFGGSAGRIGPNSETWEWDGTTWQQMQPNTVPTARLLHAMAYDIHSERVLMFGGSGRVAIGNETWVWDGSDWIGVLPSPGGPVARSRPGLSYDVIRQRVVLFGGWDDTGTDLGDTWEWGGGGWVQRAPTNSPGARAGHAMVFDLARGRTVLFGGGSSLGPVGDDLWLYGTNAPATATVIGAGCVGSNGTPAIATPDTGPWIGTTFSQELHNVPASNLAAVQIGLSSSTWAGTPLPIDLSILGMPSCSMYVSAEALVPTAPANGMADFDLAIPNLPVLLGQSIHEQAIAADPGANALGVIVSNALTLTFGAL